MRPFVYQRSTDAAAATGAAAQAARAGAQAPAQTPSSYLAGGTTLVDLMKLEVMRPEVVIDINPLGDPAFREIAAGPHGLRLGALIRMSEAADHPDVKEQYPVIAQSLQLAASAQLRNMASLGGNVLQRTRCPYFRDVSYAACNKREPGSGCAALDGVNRMHAVLGGSKQCIATYAGDFAQALIALDAAIEIAGPHGRRTIPFAELHTQPGDRPHVETTLRPDELIASFMIPAAPWARRSLYLKVRDRESYEFALASAAVALDLNGRVVRNARIALGGVATVPWRAVPAEAALRGKPLDAPSMEAAADAAFAGARGHGHNDFKIALGKRTMRRALEEAAALEI